MGNHPRTAILVMWFSKYINQILVEEKTEIYHEPAALEAAEQSFYELLGEDHSLSPPSDMTSYADQNNKSRDECHPSRSSDYNTTSWIGFGVAICVSTNPCMFLLSPILCHSMPHRMEVIESAVQFKRGSEEASRFLPNGNGQIVNLESNTMLLNEGKASAIRMGAEVRKWWI
ncbi:hypothetical protein ACFXTI_041436 [Malus domestica]